jgi:hypothetical protein
MSPQSLAARAAKVLPESFADAEMTKSMDEHDDDLTSEVTEGAEEEIDSFPMTADELEDEPEAEEKPGSKEDESEL